MLLFNYMNILKTGKETSFHGTWQESDATDWKHTQGIVKRNTLELNIWIILPLLLKLSLMHRFLNGYQKSCYEKYQVIYVGYYVVRVKYLKRNDKKLVGVKFVDEQLFRSRFRSMRVVPRIIMYYSSRNAGKAFRDFLRADNDCH